MHLPVVNKVFRGRGGGRAAAHRPECESRFLCFMQISMLLIDVSKYKIIAQTANKTSTGAVYSSTLQRGRIDITVCDVDVEECI